MRAPILTITKVQKVFGGIPAIGDFSLVLEKGEFCGIIGPNGAGKTTLMNLVTGYMRPNAGDISFLGRSIVGLRPYQCSRLGIARTFQVVRPFPEMTVLENAMTGWLFAGEGRRQRASARDECMEFLRLVGLEHRHAVLAGILTLGEKKRLELARCLATQPKLLLLDEVLGGLSEDEIQQMIPVLRNVHRTGTTIVMIEHVIRVLVQLVERIAVLNFGRNVCDGAPAEVLAHPDVIESYLGKAIAVETPAS